MYPVSGDHGNQADWDRPNWHALFVRSNQEKRVAARLDYGGVEHYLPCYQSERQWKQRRVKLEVPLFPGYLFVKLPLRERLKVLTVPNVVGLVGVRNCPEVVAEEEIHWIRRGAEQGGAVPHPVVKAGERVVITRGALEGVPGTLVRAQNKTRVLVNIDSIAQAFAVNVELADIRYLPKAQLS